ncbi:MAG: type II toxin-antitoxin system death-on-curing family toxin [Armatimonadota bacterium]
MDVIFLTLEDILVIHWDQLRRYGGSEGIRDRGLLLSALAMPEASFQGEYLHQDLPAMAAAYLFHLVQNHPFVDGNKRVGLVATLAFLRINGYRLTCPKDTVEAITWTVAQGQCEKDALISFMQQYAKVS